jgi:predicted TIM-barrel fold metal-dependent hydrolase
MEFSNRRLFLKALPGISVGIRCLPSHAEEEIENFQFPIDEGIWDLHAHLAGMEGATPQARMRRLLHFADRMGIERLCVYMGMSFSYNPTPSELRKQNDEVLQAIEVAQGRVLGFVYLNPMYPKESLDELERCVADGPMVGVKLWVSALANDAKLDAILHRATELNAVVFQHTWIKTTGNLPHESTPMDLALLAQRHPQAKMICGHAGGNWELGIRAIRSQKNVLVELGGGDPTSGFLEMALRELGAERVVFGSDVPGRSFASQLAKVAGASIPLSAKSLILAGNLKKLLQPILQQKGLSG